MDKLPTYDGADPLIRVYQVPAMQIGDITSLVEAYEGIGSVRTLDRARGLIEFWIMPAAAQTFDRLLAAMAAEFPIQRMPKDFD